VFDEVLSYLNLKNLSPELPKEAEGIYDAEKYKKQQEYYKTNDRFGLIKDAFNFILTITLLTTGFYGAVDLFARGQSDNMIFIVLIFMGVIVLISDVLGTPFSIYATFVIEEKFGFNKTTVKTFILDKLKGYLIMIVLGGGILSLVVYAYQAMPEYFWMIAWAISSVFSLFMAMFYTTLIVPLFNKLTPLEDGELKSAIEVYCNKVGFKLNNIFVIDSSKRSTSTNAFFSGLGSKKKIVLYDTLIEKHTVNEIVAIVAHEVGHYKKNHIPVGMAWGLIQTGFMFYVFSIFIDDADLAKSVGAEQASFHINSLVFGLLYTPMSDILSIVSNIFSRKHEFEADAYAKETYSGEELVSALKKMSSDNLSNLKPHPAYVFFNYSHPPLLKRLEKLM